MGVFSGPTSIVLTRFAHYRSRGAACRTGCLGQSRCTGGRQGKKKSPTKVIQASHEVDTNSDKDESIVATSGSEGSESAS